MLLHRSGTDFEDMYWIKLDDIEIVAEEEISKDYYNLTVEEYLKHGYNEDEAQMLALKELENKFDIKIKEVTE